MAAYEPVRPRQRWSGWSRFRYRYVPQAMQGILINLSILGQSGSLGVFIRENNPVDVQCNEEPQTYGRDACAQLLLSLPAAVQPRRIFGAYAVRAAGQRVDELIPTYYANGMF